MDVSSSTHHTNVMVRKRMVRYLINRTVQRLYGDT
jgi:hypothetical protein